MKRVENVHTNNSIQSNCKEVKQKEDADTKNRSQQTVNEEKQEDVRQY